MDWATVATATGTEMVGTGEETEQFGIRPQATRHYDEVEPAHFVMISENGSDSPGQEELVSAASDQGPSS